MALCTCLIYAGMEYEIYRITNDGSIENVLLLLVSLTIFACLGFIMRLSHEWDLKRRREQARRNRQDIASGLHDIVYNDLNYALWNLDGQAATVPAGDHARQADRDARDALREALRHTRHAIDMLRAPAEAGKASSGEGRALQLGRVVAEQRRKLERIHHNGMVILPDDPDAIDVTVTSPERAALAERLVRELFGNIAKHADPAGEYVFSIGVNAAQLYLSVSDSPLRSTETQDAPADSGRTGHGLSYYRERIAELGGTMTVTPSPDSWAVIIRLPLGG